MTPLKNSDLDLDIIYRKTELPNIELGDKINVVIYLKLPRVGRRKKDKERI